MFGRSVTEKTFVDIPSCFIFIVFKKTVHFKLLLSGDTLWSDLKDVSKRKKIISNT